MQFRFLGTGTSVGVPQIGCGCKVCTSTDPRDRRRRCGAWVEGPEGAFLIDTPPELRLACVEYGIARVDAIVLTHAHMDHVAGFDDVRRFNTINGKMVPCDPNEPGANGRTYKIVGKPLICYAMEETARQMHTIFPYISLESGKNGLYRPQISFCTDDKFETCGVKIERLRVEHGFPCCGYLIADKLAYISDCHEISDDVLARLKGVDTLILNCLRERFHPTHLSLEAALKYIGAISPRRALLTHMCHDLLHTEWQARLPNGVEPAYDGQVLDF